MCHPMLCHCAYAYVCLLAAGLSIASAFKAVFPCLATLDGTCACGCAPLASQHERSGSAKTDPVRFKWGFGEGRLKDKVAFFEACKILCLRGENCLQNPIFISKKGPLKKTLKLDQVSFPLPRRPLFQKALWLRSRHRFELSALGQAHLRHQPPSLAQHGAPCLARYARVLSERLRRL